MAGYNRIIIMGNLTRDPDYKQLVSGHSVCKLGIASNRQYKNRHTGALVQEVCFVDIDIFGPQAETCRQYLQKGRAVLIEGRLKFDSWQTAEGQTRSKHSIVADRVVFLGNSTTNTDETFSEAHVGSDQFTGMNTENVSPVQSISSKKQAKNEISASIDAKNTKSDSQLQTGELAFTDEPPFQDDLPF